MTNMNKKGNALAETHWRLAIGTWLLMLGMLVTATAWAVTQSSRITVVENRYVELLAEVRASRQDSRDISVELKAITLSLMELRTQQAIWHRQVPPK